MLKWKLLLFAVVTMLSGLLIYSCSKDAVKTENQELTTPEAELQAIKSILNIGEEEITSLRTETECGNPDCYLLLPGVKDTVLISSTGCYAEVTYDLYRCFTSGPPPTTVTEIFKNFKAVPIESMGCTTLLDDWKVLYDNGDFGGLATALDVFNAQASEAVEADRVNYFFTSQPYMQTFFRCGKENKYIVEFYMNNCFKWCISYSTDTGKPVWDFVRTNCTDNCCKRTRQYCWDKDLMQIKIESESYIEVGECTEVEEAKCGEGYIQAGSCIHKCFPLE